MNFLRYGFVLGMIFECTLSLLRDRETYRRGNLRKSLRRFRKSPVVSKELWLQLKDYNRPDFHPDDRDTNELVTTWREKLFGTNGTLNDLLVGSAA
jgi:predicted metal-dependent hydrolase